MINNDAATFASLGRALASAHDDGILSSEEFAPLARSLAAAIATGLMPLDAYTAIHRALAGVLEAVFADPHLSAGLPSGLSGSSSGAISEESIGDHLEVIAAVWERVEPPDAALQAVQVFFDKAFDLSRARFGGDFFFAAPLRVFPEELSTLLRQTGITLHAVEGTPPSVGELIGVLAGAHDPPRGPRLQIGWGKRRFYLRFEESFPA
jgi:hypothetical protein